MKYCSSCGALLPDDNAKYCSACGALQPREPSPYDTGAAANTTPPQAPNTDTVSAQALPKESAPSVQSQEAPRYSAPAQSTQPSADADPFAILRANAPAAPQPPVPTSPPTQPAAEAAPSSPEREARDSGFSLFIDALGSSRMLIIIVLLIVGVVCSVFSSFAMGSLSDFGSSFLAVIAQVLPVLECVALWLCWNSARGVQQGGQFSTSGLSIYRVSYIISSIFSWISFATVILLLLFLGAVMAAMGPYSSGSDWSTAELDSLISVLSSGLVFVIDAVLVAALVASVIYFIKMMKTLDALCQTARTGWPTAFVSQFVIVVNYILAALTPLLLFGSVAFLGGQNVLYRSLNSGAVMLLVVSVGAQSAALVLISLGMSTYKARAEAIYAHYSAEMNAQTAPAASPETTAQ